MRKKLIDSYIYSSAALLILTATAKFVSITGRAQILNQADPIFIVPYRTVFFLTGGIEVAVALVCFFSKRLWLRSCLLAWMATQFLAYRLGIGLINVHYCGCLGTLTDALPMNANLVHTLLVVMLAYLLAGSYAAVGWLYWQQRKTNGF